MTVEELRYACVAFEEKHGVEAFLDALALIMQDRLKLHGLEIEFSDEPSGLASDQPNQRLTG